MTFDSIKIRLLLLFVNITAIVFGQSLDQGRKSYNEGDYATAKPVFEKYVQISPKDASYNLWYGVCLYATGELEAAEKYLAFAVSKKVPEAYSYLGQLYFRTYRFGEAAEVYEAFIDLQKKKRENTEPYEKQLILMQKANRMLENTEDIQIIDSMIVDKNDILSAYHLSPESGRLHYFDDFFENDQLEPGNTVYLNQRANRVLFSFGNRNTSYDLFILDKNMEGWTDDQRLPVNINSEKNEKYPFTLTDGVTLYFASDKEGTIGGYDLYVTRFNTNTNTYLNPEQLGMPFNSIYNDYLMVIDEVKGVGWFASDRFQPEGKVIVYTFIPNDSKKIIESDSIEYKQSRAMITFIEESWRPQADYTEIQQKARTVVVREEKKRDFIFAINDHTTYYTLNDFKDQTALNLFIKAQQTRESLAEITKQLQQMRETYSKGSQEEKKQLTNSILTMESRQEQLEAEIQRLEVLTRNTEIKFINKK